MPFDADAGTKQGLEFWRIEKMEPARQDLKDLGKLYSGDCYIFLNTYEKKGVEYQDLFFWLGKDCTQDERGAAAYQTVNLDDQLGGKPVQHREVQGHESQQFLALFPNGLRYEDGGIESGFNHVDPDAYEPRLFQVKGKRNPRMVQVALSVDSMNDGDAFILDAGLKLYQWNGRSANKYEKFQALQNITRINDDERGHKAEIFILEDGKDDDDDFFWETLGGRKAVTPADQAPSDDEVKESEKALFRVSDASGTMKCEEVGRGKLKRDMLDKDDCFLLDTGAVVYVWVGKGATKEERKKSMEFGAQYLKDNNRPDWTPLTRIPGGGEPPEFQACFVQWNPPRVVQFNTEKKVEEVDDSVDVAALRKRQKQAEEKMVDDGTGKVDIWRIENMARAEWPKNLYGQFFAGDSFIVLYTYKKGTKDAWIIYFWQGKESSTDEKGASALLAKEMDDELGGDPVQVRVVQGKEPPHFLQLFKGKMIVHHGGHASAFKNKNDTDSYDTDGISLFHVKGTNEINTRAVQVEEVATSLNSGDCFVLLTPDVMYVWQGVGANAEEKATAENIAKVLQFKRSLEIVAEGSEPDAFWEAIGGKAEYPSTQEVPPGDIEPRLFHGTTGKTGHFTMSEVFNFDQDDLINDDIMILDAYNEVFVWVGHDSNKKERDRGFETALNYVKTADDGRDPDTPVYKVHAGSEPPNFTCHFLGWNDAKASDFEDPYLKKMGKLGVKTGGRKKAKLEKVSAADIGFAKGVTFSIEELRNNTAANIDPKKKETYLTDADFQEVFKMSRDEFNKQKAWKQKDLKKKAGLF